MQEAVAQGDEGEGRVGDGSLEKWQCAGAGCWLWVAEVKDVMQAVGGVLPQVHGDVDPDECEVLVVGVSRGGKPVEEQGSCVGGGSAKSGVKGPVCMVLEGHVGEAVEKVGR